MNAKKSLLTFLCGLFLFGFVGSTGCAAEAEPEASEETQQAIAPAVALGACLLDPPCAAAVAAVVGYAVYSVSQLSGEALRAAQRAAENWRRQHERNCQACPAPPPDDSRYDASHSHWPCPGPHTHHYTYRYNQNPTTCECHLQKIQASLTCH